MRILISACLLGARCRYDGVSKLQPWISDLAERHILVPVCPEQLGGLPTPRPPAERRGDRVMTRDGGDVTAQYRRGAEEALRLCRLLGCEAALLNEGIGSGYACLTLDGVSTTKSRNLIQADRGAGGDGLGFSDLGTLLIDYADRDIAGVVGITGDQGESGKMLLESE